MPSMAAKPIATKDEDLTLEEALKFLQMSPLNPSYVPHEEFMKHVNHVVSALSKCQRNIPIVADDEEGICKAIDQHLPRLT